MSAQFHPQSALAATALQKIEGADAPTTAIKRGAAHLWIADPVGRRLTAQEGCSPMRSRPIAMAKRIASCAAWDTPRSRRREGSVG